MPPLFIVLESVVTRIRAGRDLSNQSPDLEVVIAMQHWRLSRSVSNVPSLDIAVGGNRYRNDVGNACRKIDDHRLELSRIVPTVKPRNQGSRSSTSIGASSAIARPDRKIA